MKSVIKVGILVSAFCFLFSGPLFGQSMACAGGPPVYCARQDWVPVPGNPAGAAPAAISGVTGAGEMTISPSFGARIVRLSDVNVYGNPTIHAAMTGFAGDAGGSDEAEPMSLHDDFFYLWDNGVNGPILYSFDPINMIPNRLYQTSYPSTNGLLLTDGKAAEWSPVQDDVLYEWGTASSDYEIWHWTFSSLTTPPSTSTLDKNLTTDSNCDVLPASPEWFSDMSVSNDGNNFAVSASAGAQDTATIGLVWQKSTNTCAWINLSNGEYGGNLGGSGTISDFTTGDIHNLRMFGNGEWLRIDYSTDSTAVWQVGTGNYYYCNGVGLPCGGGHIANGYNSFNTGVGADLTPYYPKLYGNHAASNPTTYNVLNASVPYSGYDTHVNWMMDNASDNMPMALSGDGVGTNYYPWNDEVNSLSTNFSQMDWRFSRTWALEYNYYFNAEHAIGQASRDGKFFMLTTDWGGSFGSTEYASISSWSRSGNVVTVTATSPICASGTLVSGDTFTIEDAALGTDGTSINGTWVGTLASVAAPTAAPTLSTATTGGYIPASTVVTVGVAYRSNSSGAGSGCYTMISPTAQITTGSSTATNTVTVTSPGTETGAPEWVPFACLGSSCTPISQTNTAVGTNATVGALAATGNSSEVTDGLYNVGFYGGGSGIDHLPPMPANGANGDTMTFTQNAANDSSSTAAGVVLDSTCNIHNQTASCRYDTVVVEMK